MPDILEKIIANTRLQLTTRKAALPLSKLSQQLEIAIEQETLQTSIQRSLSQALRKSDTGIIAEFKRKSPSLGWIKEEGRPEDIPLAYEQNGATATSILTDKTFFGGSHQFIQTARPLLSIPILCKDFIIDEYQLLEAKLAGADVVLLIAACLTQLQCRLLAYRAQQLGLEVLLEVHNEQEIAHFAPGVTAIGVNNRNLKTFITHIETSKQLAHYLPEEVVRVSESGLSNPDDVKELRAYGYRGFLMGERFMTQPQPGIALAQFITQLL